MPATQAITEFCRASVQISSLISPLNTLNESGVQNVNDRINTLVALCEKFDDSNNSVIKDEFDSKLLSKLENTVISFWNTLTIAWKTIENNKCVTKEHEDIILRNSKLVLTLNCKYLVCQLLKIHELYSKSLENYLRSLNCQLKAFKLWSENCLLTEANSIGTKIELMIQKQFDHITKVDINTIYNIDSSSSNKMLFDKYYTEYYICCFQMALKKEDIEQAHNFEEKAKLEKTLCALDPDLGIEICRQFFNTCLEVFEREVDNVFLMNDLLLFIQRLKKYLSIPDAMIQNHLEYSNLKFSTDYLLIKITIDISKKKTYLESETLTYLEQFKGQFPERIEPYAAIITYCKDFDTEMSFEKVESTIMEMIMTVDVKTNFDMIISSIGEFSRKNTVSSMLCLDYLIFNKINAKEDRNDFEKAIIARFYLTTQSNIINSEVKATGLYNFLNEVEKVIIHEFSNTTVATIIALLWNEAKKLEKNDCLQDSILYYKLVTKDMLCQNYTDSIKLFRALANLYLRLDDITAAEKLLAKFSDENKRDSLTQLIYFRIFSKQRKIDEATKILETISKLEDDKVPSILMMAVTECKDIPSLSLSAILLLYQNIKLDTTETNKDKIDTLVVPTLGFTRYTIQSILKINESNFPQSILSYINTIVQMVQKCKQFLEKTRIAKLLNVSNEEHSDTILIDEIEWLCATCYNITSKLFEKKCVTTESLSLLTEGLEIFQYIPSDDLTFPKRLYYLTWKFRCQILLLLILKADPKLNTQNLDLGSQSKLILDNILALLGTNDYQDCKRESFDVQLQECIVLVLQLYFQETLNLGGKDELLSLAAKLDSSLSTSVDQILVEAVIKTRNIPPRTFTTILTMIIDRNINNSKLRDVHICYWIRSLFEYQMSLNESISFSFINSLLTRIESSKQHKYETSEIMLQDLEAITTCCWNYGINQMLNKNYTDGEKWCQVAIRVSSLVNQNLVLQLRQLWEQLLSCSKMK
ncbi:uncharacterized protein GWK60_M12727 [Nakaseomyces glabratus]|nr:Meiosis protein SPO22/ZIP4 like [Nakaseomyces glabratus]QNG17266.1 uncharacterized protein GWK60_M12727 [Nakaseomyces glabratus]